jgi:N-methylhydantoinase A
MIIVGIDTGGTFTDFVAYDGDGIRVHKELSTPLAPERAILAGLHALGIDHTDTRVVHGSTVATNTLLEGTGARTVFITNRGFGDTLTIGRQARAALYDLTPPQPEPPVARELCLETGGRVGADGVVVGIDDP